MKAVAADAPEEAAAAGDGGGGPRGPAPVEHTPAFAELNRLLDQGQLDPQTCAELKQKYAQLHDVVLKTLESEKALLQRARDLNAKRLAKQEELANKVKEGEGRRQRVAKLKAELEEKSLEVQQFEQKRDMLVLEMEQLEQNREGLVAEMAQKKRTTEELTRPRIEKLTAQVADLKTELEQIKAAEAKEILYKEECEKRIAECKAETEALEKEKAKRRQELGRIKTEPDRLKTETELASIEKRKLEKQNKALAGEIKDLEGNLKSLRKKKAEVDKDRYQHAEKLMRLREAMERKERDVDDINRRLEHAKQQAQSAEEEKLKLELDIQHKRDEQRQEQDSLNKFNRLYEEQKRKHEKLRRKVAEVKQSIDPLKQEYESTVRAVAGLESDEKRAQKALTELKQDVDIYIANYLADENREADLAQQLIKYQEDIKVREEHIKQRRQKERGLLEAIKKLKAKRALLLREASKSRLELRETQEQLKVKDLVIMDLHKKRQTVRLKLKQSRKMYEMVKTARNKYATLTQNSHQALSEMKEKIKIVQNEVDILRNESIAKDRALVEESRILQAAQYTRDALRLEQNKCLQQLAEAREVVRRNDMDIKNLHLIIKTADAEMTSIRARYKRVVRNRNTAGIQLIDRNDELSILYEKKNILEGILKKGEAQISEKEDEIRRANQDLKDLEWQVKVARSQMPSTQEQEAARRKYEELEYALEQEQKRVLDFSQQLEDPHPEMNKNRYRKLPGKDPSKGQLEAQIAVMNSRLNNQKEQLLEKELVLEEVSVLSNKLRMQAAEGHQITLKLAKKMNEYQSKIKKLTRKMMAIVSELSMYQATAIKLEQEKYEVEEELERARERMERGEAPTPDAEHAWLRIERERLQRHQQMMQPPPVPDDGQVHSTAEPRPNAYIPDDIGIPKPYGGWAPFKPSQLGANMRHIRKPESVELQPVDD